MFAAGYGGTVGRGLEGLARGSSGEVPPSATRGKSLTPEFRIDPATGRLDTQPGQVVSPSSCLGCWTQCADGDAGARGLRPAGRRQRP